MTGTCEECNGYALIPFDATKPDESNDLSKNGAIKIYCKDCFEKTSVLDFSKTYDVIEPITKTASGEATTFVMVHGGGGTREMFRPYADILATKGFRSVLLDLPGHGSLVEKPLSLDSTLNTVQDILDKEKLDKKKTIYVGGSLGAYVGFYVLNKLKDRFCGAVLMDCGQNVGPDCSLKASVGLFIIRIVTKAMSNKGITEAMLGVTKKSPADWKLVESTFGAGFRFDQAVQQVECLHTVKPADHIPSYDFPILFFNGSEDHRDSEDKWLSLCKDQERSSLKVYEGGDHFFSHDSRFVDDIIERMEKFACQLVEINLSYND
jgi:pimeloyl-ACP methyl ester carboxylesterase